MSKKKPAKKSAKKPAKKPHAATIDAGASAPRSGSQDMLLDVRHDRDVKLNGHAMDYRAAVGEYSRAGASVRGLRTSIVDRMAELGLACYDDGDVRIDLKHKDDGIAVRVYDVEEE